MCETCGCQDNDTGYSIRKVDNSKTNHHDHHHDGHDHHHHHDDHDHPHPKKISIEKDILGSNNLLAERNRGYFEARNIFCINMVSSPGSGKTSLIEATIKELKVKLKIYVIEGDQQGLLDAQRIEKAGAEVIQINTGDGCHLTAQMVNDALKKLDPPNGSLLFIENVGNLVCPALFDLGESKRVVVSSVTEGDDKPLKYPNMFLTSDLCVINKTDLLPYLDFDMAKFRDYAMRINHHLEFIEISVRNGENLNGWVAWLERRL
jgi:hydrogenase nickel incorporation protein HypB